MKIRRDGRFSLGNIAGDISVSAGSGDEVSIEAIKRTRGDKSELARVQILVDDRPGRIDVRTEHEQNRSDRNGRGNHVSVDYTIVVPATASVDLHSVSGGIKVTGVHGSLRSETVSGDVTITDAPKLEAAKTVSGDLSLTGITTDGDLMASAVSGNGRKGRRRAASTGAGQRHLRHRGGLRAARRQDGQQYRAWRYRQERPLRDQHPFRDGAAPAHHPAGFELTANSFSGSIRSELPLTIGGDSARRDDSPRGRRDSGMNSHSMRATFGDGSATLVVRTFSGDIIIAKR